jgi:hypothetical protein
MHGPTCICWANLTPCSLQIPGRGVQTVDIRTPVFVSPPSKGSSVGVAMTLFHVNPAGVFSGLRPALITRSNHSL